MVRIAGERSSRAFVHGWPSLLLVTRELVEDIELPRILSGKPALRALRLARFVDDDELSS